MEDAKDIKQKQEKKLDRKEKKLKEMQSAFLEEGTQDKFIGRAIKAIKQWWTRDPYCDDNCQKIKSFKYYWYVNAVVRGAEPKIKVKDTVDIMKNELGEMVNTFAALKAIILSVTMPFTNTTLICTKKSWQLLKKSSPRFKLQ